MEQSAFLSGACSSWGCWCRQPRRGAGEMAEAHSKQPSTLALALAPARAEKHVEAADLCCAGSGGILSPRPPSPPLSCSLQDLPPELLVEIFASLPVTDLPSLAQACTKFHSILHTASIWRRRCREEYGVCGNFQDLEVMGLSCREFYTKLLHPYRNILGLWRLDNEARRGLLKVEVDGFCITGWKYLPRVYYRNVGVPVQWKPSFRIRLTERKSAVVECMEEYNRPFNCRFHRAGPHVCHLTIQKDWLTTDCRKTAWFQKNVRQRVCEAGGLLTLQKPREAPLLNYPDPDRLTYRRVYLPQSQPEDLIRPGIFRSTCDAFYLKMSVLSFHGKFARATMIWGDPIFSVGKQTLEIHLMHRIQLPNVEILRDFRALSRIVQEIDQQVIQEQQAVEAPEDSEGHGWRSPAQPSVRESGAAALEEQPAHSFVLPAGVRSTDRNCPPTYRMCFYGVNMVHFYSFTFTQRCPGIFILFDENHFGFLCVKQKFFSLQSRIQDTFKNVEAPSPQAFLEMLNSIQVPWENLEDLS